MPSCSLKCDLRNGVEQPALSTSLMLTWERKRSDGTGFQMAVCASETSPSSAFFWGQSTGWCSWWLPAWWVALGSALRHGVGGAWQGPGEERCKLLLTSEPAAPSLRSRCLKKEDKNLKNKLNIEKKYQKHRVDKNFT